MTVIQPWLRLTGQLEHHMSDDITTSYLRILEYRITITVLALLHIEIHKLFLNSVVAINCLDDILNLNSIRSDILHSGSTDLTRDIRQVLHTPKAFLSRPLTEIVEDYSGTYRYEDWRRRFLHSLRSVGHRRSRWSACRRMTVDILTALIQNLYEINLGMQDSTFEVIGKEKIAAATDVEDRPCKLLKLDVHKISHRIILNETAGLHLHAEGVHLGQILIILGPYHMFTTSCRVSQITDNQQIKSFTVVNLAHLK